MLTLTRSTEEGGDLAFSDEKGARERHVQNGTVSTTTTLDLVNSQET
jgi:hypothetical protein